MRIDIVTIFPAIAEGPLGESMMKRARDAGLVDIRCHDLRDYSADKNRRVDDLPYGGGPGMVMKPEPFFAAVESLRTPDAKVLLMTPQGRPFIQKTAEVLAKERHIIILCGHYEGVDHRVVEALVDEEISIGDYVLTNGTIAAAVITDAVVRLIPGVLGDDRSSQEESFSGDGKLIEAPHYTRPPEFDGWSVPAVLQSGHHEKIGQWRLEQAIKRTRRNRPDLLE